MQGQFAIPMLQFTRTSCSCIKCLFFFWSRTVVDHLCGLQLLVDHASWLFIVL